MPLVLDITLALILLLVAPSFMKVPLHFLYYFAPDIFWLTIAIVTIPLGRDILKGLAGLRIIRAARPVRRDFFAS
jgi:hypothetical protein